MEERIQMVESEKTKKEKPKLPEKPPINTIYVRNQRTERDEWVSENMSENKEKGSKKQDLPKEPPKLPKVPPIKTMPIRSRKDKKEKIWRWF